jgi:hypothetical protein
MASRSGISSLVVFFVAVSFATWIVWVPRALNSRGLIDADWAAGLGIGWTYAPALTAVLFIALTRGRAGLADLGRRLIRWRIGWRWYATIIAIPLGIALGMAAIYALTGGQFSQALPLAFDLPLLLIPATLAILCSPTEWARRQPGAELRYPECSGTPTQQPRVSASASCGRCGTCHSSSPAARRWPVTPYRCCSFCCPPKPSSTPGLPAHQPQHPGRRPAPRTRQPPPGQLADGRSRGTPRGHPTDPLVGDSHRTRRQERPQPWSRDRHKESGDNNREPEHTLNPRCRPPLRPGAGRRGPPPRLPRPAAPRDPVTGLRGTSALPAHGDGRPRSPAA